MYESKNCLLPLHVNKCRECQFFKLIVVFDEVDEKICKVDTKRQEQRGQRCKPWLCLLLKIHNRQYIMTERKISIYYVHNRNKKKTVAVFTVSDEGVVQIWWLQLLLS